MIEGLLALLCIHAIGFAYLAKQVNFICLIFLNALPALLDFLSAKQGTNRWRSDNASKVSIVTQG